MFAYFATEQELRAVLTVETDLTLELFESCLQRAETQHLLPVMGPALREMQEKADEQLLALVRPALANFAARLYAGGSQRRLNSLGSHSAQGDKETANTGKLVQQHRADLADDAEAQLEQALVYLEGQPEKYASWHSSRLCTLNPGHFFTTADQLQDYAPAPITRKAFRSMRTDIETAEWNKVRRVLGPTLYPRLLAEQDQAQHRDLVHLVRAGIAGTLSFADDRRAHAGDSALVRLRHALQERLTDYPEFEDSPSFIPTDIGPDTSSNPFYCAL